MKKVFGGRSSTASHFAEGHDAITAGAAEDSFYGVELNNDISRAPAWQIVGLLVVVVGIIFQPTSLRRKDLSLAYWAALVSAACSFSQATLIPILSSVIYTRTSYPYLIVIPHCVLSSAIYRSKHGNDAHYLQSLVGSFFLYGFGGSIVSDLLMGLPVTALSHPRILPCHALGWALVWLCPFDAVYVGCVNRPRSVLSIAFKACEAVDAVTTPMGRVSRSARELRNKGAAPIVAGLLAGGGGATLRALAGEPGSTSIAALEGAFWKTLCYSVLWWVLAVHRCEISSDDPELQEWNHCSSYGGSDLARVGIVCGHTLWTMLVEMGVVAGHPFVWLCKKVFVERTEVHRILQLGPQFKEEVKRKKLADAAKKSD